MSANGKLLGNSIPDRGLGPNDAIVRKHIFTPEMDGTYGAIKHDFYLHSENTDTINIYWWADSNDDSPTNAGQSANECAFLDLVEVEINDFNNPESEDFKDGFVKDTPIEYILNSANGFERIDPNNSQIEYLRNGNVLFNGSGKKLQISKDGDLRHIFSGNRHQPYYQLTINQTIWHCYCSPW